MCLCLINMLSTTRLKNKMFFEWCNQDNEPRPLLLPCFALAINFVDFILLQRRCLTIIFTHPSYENEPQPSLQLATCVIQLWCQFWWWSLSIVLKPPNAKMPYAHLYKNVSSEGNGVGNGILVDKIFSIDRIFTFLAFLYPIDGR